jgi:hypothetical protein
MRVEVHNLRHGEIQERQGKSENHLTFALLLGDGQSVRFDMTPDAITHIGSMVVQGLDENGPVDRRQRSWLPKQFRSRQDTLTMRERTFS